MWAVYAFCRTADDIADGPGSDIERVAALDDWERQLEAAYAGEVTQPIFAAFADAARRWEIPKDPALDLLRGARMDVGPCRYETYDELREYCYLVASTVGLLVLPILGTISDDALPFAVTLGRAMQMTNILRDVGEDARMGRIYLPREDLRAFGCSEAAIFAGELDDGFVEMMRFQIARVRRLYTDAEPGIALLRRESRYTVRLARTLYSRILTRIEKNRFDVFTRRAYVPLRSKVAMALAATAW